MGCILDREAGTSTEKGIDIKEIEPELSGTGLKNYTLCTGFELPVQWSATFEGNEFRIPVDTLIFPYDECKFMQKGKDDNGLFVARGRFVLNGDVKIEIIYGNSEANKTFEGKFADKAVIGDWHDNSGNKGSFRLEIIVEQYRADTFSLFVKDTPEQATGIACFSYGYAVFSGKPVDPFSNDKQFLLQLVFADKEKGTFNATFLPEGISGQLTTPKGTENLTLTVKNEFD